MDQSPSRPNSSFRGVPDDLKFPQEPYPGLRPFLAFESALLCGRDKQIQDVLNHLGSKKFVAVIGGSGSGKSSLVRAGVVPGLRSYGIPGAGDFWVPMVCTPGTNVAAAASDGDADTPLRRLAWKFSQLLRPLDNVDAEHQRTEHIAKLLRGDTGFSEVIDAYSGQLPPRSGLGGADARFLLVIDQFEELFHPTNRDDAGRMIEDGRLLVERIIDHFFAPHERCYVVLTMRSEHLNDCAGFLELPDVINQASYLVGRLDDAQLREAIVEPARSYLRVRQREAREGDLLPSDVVFEEKPVLNRLLRDVQSIAHDPDHLPLLQHVLSRTWDAALARSGAQTLPEIIGADDLARAVRADASATWSMLADDENVLRTCLISHADAIVRCDSDQQKIDIDEMLRLLAFKDPNTGMYSQQRINIDDRNREHYMALVEHGLIGQVNYLHWDKENPERVTLKVSHESFIRGWPRFRELIDREAERFEEFMQVLRACARWKQGEKADSLLLEGAQLRNLHEAGLQAELNEPRRRSRWFRFLAFVRDGQRYRALEAVVDTFIMRSLQRDERQRHEVNMAERRQREMEISIATERAENEVKEQRIGAALASADKLRLEMELSARQTSLQFAEARAKTAHAQLQTARAEAEAAEAQAQNDYSNVLGRRHRQIILGNSLLLIVVVFWLAIEYPVRVRIEPFFAVLRSIDSVNTDLRGSSFSVAHDQLTRGLRVVDDLGRGLSGKADLQESNPPLGIKYLGKVPGIEGRREFFDNVSNLVEPRVNGTLRQLLTGYPWPVKGDAGTKWLSARVLRVNECTVPSSAIGEKVKVDGTVYVANASVPSSGTPRALIVTDPNEWDQSWDIRPVMELKETGGRISQCTAGPSIWRSPPAESRPAVAFDATLQYLLQLTFNARLPVSQAGTISVTELSWLPGPSGSEWVVGSRPPVVQQDIAAVTALESALRNKLPSRDVDPAAASSTSDKPRSPHVALATASSTAGVLVKVVENQQWRLVATEASSIPSSLATQFAQKLGPEGSTSACNRLREPVANESQSRDPGLANVVIYPHGGYCFAVIRGTPTQGYTPSGYEAVRVSVYPPPLSAAGDPQPIASMSFGFQPKAADRWLVAESGSYKGWIALVVSEDKNGTVSVGAPWSTAAVVKLGKDLLSSAPNFVESPADSKSGVKK